MKRTEPRQDWKSRIVNKFAGLGVLPTTAPVLEFSLAPIERALHAGGKLHAFLSGGGLRVVTIESPEPGLRGYGEHPHIEDALAHCCEDLEAKGRAYDKVYGKLYPHYLTGSSGPSSDLDEQLLRGRTIDAMYWYDFDLDFVFKVEISTYEAQQTPDDVYERCKAGETVEWEARGCRYRSEPYTFHGDGERGARTAVIYVPEGTWRTGAFHWCAKKTGHAATLEEAFAAAIKAEPIEVPDNRTRI